jgi:hypothetical protein
LLLFAARFLADDSKATRWPSPEIDGKNEVPPVASLPAELTLTTSIVPLAATAAGAAASRAAVAR